MRMPFFSLSFFSSSSSQPPPLSSFSFFLPNYKNKGFSFRAVHCQNDVVSSLQDTKRCHLVIIIFK